MPLIQYYLLCILASSSDSNCSLFYILLMTEQVTLRKIATIEGKSYAFEHEY